MNSKLSKKPPRRVENVPAVKRQVQGLMAYATPARYTGEIKPNRITYYCGSYTVCEAAVAKMPEIETDESSEFSFQLLSRSIVPEQFPTPDKAAFVRRIK
jgi:hypothetical protein